MGLWLTTFQANALAPNWGQTIFQSANEIAANAQLRAKYEELQAQAKVDREWWDRKRASIKDDFMKELDNSRGNQNASKASTPAAMVSAGGSDEDAVLVEGGGPAVGGKGGVKKKKSKK